MPTTNPPFKSISPDSAARESRIQKKYPLALFSIDLERSYGVEKRIRVSTQGRLTIPKILRDSLKISDGQSIIVKSVEGKRELIIELTPTMNDFAGGT